MAKKPRCESCGTTEGVQRTGHIPSSFEGETPEYLCVSCYQARVGRVG